MIKKVIIPVAGAGTRFLPATKAQPKEMLPIIDKPVVQYIVEEAVASGIEEVILVTGGSKRSIEDHFDNSRELEHLLREQGKTEALEEIQRIANLANFIYVRQKGPYGNGTPILNCEHIIGNEPFAVIWGDDLFVGDREPRLKQLIDAYEEHQAPILSCVDIDDEGTKKYGVIEGETIDDNTIAVHKIIEKPGPEKTTSRLGAIGAYILTPDIFAELKETALGKDNELWLVDALSALLRKRPVFARRAQGKFFDTGSKIGWLKANIDLALQRDDLRDEVQAYLKSISDREYGH